MNPGNGDGNSHKTRPTISWDSDAVRNPLPKRSELPDNGNHEKTTAPGAFPCRIREPAVWCDRNGDPHVLGMLPGGLALSPKTGL